MNYFIIMYDFLNILQNLLGEGYLVRLRVGEVKDTLILDSLKNNTTTTKCVSTMLDCQLLKNVKTSPKIWLEELAEEIKTKFESSEKGKKNENNYNRKRWIYHQGLRA